MRESDLDLVKTIGDKWPKALMAAAISLREDRRMTAMPVLRAQLEEICALRAIGSDVSIGAAKMGRIAKDDATYADVTEAMKAAEAAAKKAVTE